ncbi:DUF1501 domain-containing protein [Sphingomonas sp. LY29]|uniref:DUF1501 domain-containing protein n=1 Tax=Sphingomonas sp. LY29 TaxID=3095341 RepID=UPI002D776CB6|nr:DUF1501 domain-containing protein [Sphingomonas sp. LY29]WRP25406.1 DUF1501 domain-containing protein [Sphingomonas sp. LY29]
MFDRRNILQLGSVGAALLAMPKVTFAAGARTEKRFLFVIQRGAADGLAILAPTGDPAFAGLRGDLAAEAATGAKLNSMFTLHPALAETAKLYAQRQALFVHAVASPYRDRSHFDGQNVLESGGAGAYRVKDGWMNRLLGELPGGKAVALAPTVPLALRGSRPVASYAPSNIPAAADDLLLRIGDLYEQDAQLAPLWSEAQAARMKAGDIGTARGGAAAGALAAKLMSGADGARVAMIETNGWDTHNGQRGRIAAQLRGLDAMVTSLRAGLGTAWNDTLVLVATEFGRTARVNGTGGTDHGTGASAMLLGGAVAGGKVVADWPGLSDASLYEGRDLKPTIDLDALVATALAQHFGLDPVRSSVLLFPETRPKALSQPLMRG